MCDSNKHNGLITQVKLRWKYLMQDSFQVGQAWLTLKTLYGSWLDSVMLDCSSLKTLENGHVNGGGKLLSWDLLRSAISLITIEKGAQNGSFFKLRRGRACSFVIYNFFFSWNWSSCGAQSWHHFACSRENGDVGYFWRLGEVRVSGLRAQRAGGRRGRICHGKLRWTLQHLQYTKTNART